MQRRASAAAARLARRALAPPPVAHSPLALAAALPLPRAAGLRTSARADFAWGRFGGGDDSPIVSLGRTGTTPHVGVVICPQQTALVVERLGKFDRVLEPGLHLLIPLVDRVGYSWSLKEEAIPIKAQQAITRDNVSITIDGVLYVKVVDPKRASYGVENLLYAVVQLAQSAMRNELGKITLDKTFEEREALNANIVRVINEASSAWGLDALRYEIRDIAPPRAISAAMEMQAEAERRKRAAVLDSEGERQAAINRAEGMKQKTILESEAAMLDTINRAKGEAAAILARAEATSRGVEMLAETLRAPGGDAAAQLRVAEQYLAAFGNIAKAGTTMLLPSAANEPSSMVAQALSIYKSMGGPGGAGGGAGGAGGTRHAVHAREEGGAAAQQAGAALRAAAPKAAKERYVPPAASLEDEDEEAHRRPRFSLQRQ